MVHLAKSASFDTTWYKIAQWSIAFVLREIMHQSIEESEVTGANESTLINSSYKGSLVTLTLFGQY